MDKHKNFYERFIYGPGRRSMKTNLKDNKKHKDTINSPTVFADMLNKKFVNFATTVDGSTTQELRKCFENSDDKDDSMFAFPFILTNTFKPVGNLKHNKVDGVHGLSAEVLKTLLPLIYFDTFYFYLFLYLSRGLSSYCLNDAKYIPFASWVS